MVFNNNNTNNNTNNNRIITENNNNRRITENNRKNNNGNKINITETVRVIIRGNTTKQVEYAVQEIITQTRELKECHFYKNQKCHNQEKCGYAHSAPPYWENASAIEQTTEQTTEIEKHAKPSNSWRQQNTPPRKIQKTH